MAITTGAPCSDRSPRWVTSPAWLMSTVGNRQSHRSRRHRDVDPDRTERNAMGPAFLGRTAEVFEKLDADPDVRAIVLTSSG